MAFIVRLKPDSIFTLMGSSLDSLGSSGQQSVVVNNSSGLWSDLWLEMTWQHVTNPVTFSYIYIWMFPRLDGTNEQYSGGISRDRTLVAYFRINNTSIQQKSFALIKNIPPTNFSLFICNQATTAFVSGGNTLKGLLMTKETIFE
jgi:hypothetical protein